MDRKNETGRRIVDPVIYISPEAKTMLDLYILLADGEVSGLGELLIFGKKDFLITKIYLLPQECTLSNTKLTKQGLREFMMELIKNGDDPAKIKLWWHSHGDLDVFWSKMTDCRTIERFKNQWMVSIVGNRDGEYLGRVDVYKPIRLTQDNLELRILLPSDEALIAQVTAEMKQKVVFHEEKSIKVLNTPVVSS